MGKKHTFTFTELQVEMLIDAIGEFQLAIDPMDNDSTQYNGWDRRALQLAKGKLLGARRKDFDQFMLYLDKETHLIEILHFTVRDKIPVGKLTAVFQDFREVQTLTLPYSQYVRMGSPMEHRLGMHENHYEYMCVYYIS